MDTAVERRRITPQSNDLVILASVTLPPPATGKPVAVYFRNCGQKSNHFAGILARIHKNNSAGGQNHSKIAPQE